MAKSILHRMVIEVDKAQYLKLRGELLTKKGQTVSDWIREKIDQELREPINGQYRTTYGKSNVAK